jgi:hypothetical protein
MGFFGSLIGLDQQKQAFNAVLANHFIENSSAGVKRQLAKQILTIQMDVKGRYAKSPAEELRDLSMQPRIVQMQFIALSCNNLGMGPKVPNNYFYEVENPYRARDGVNEMHFKAVIDTVAKNSSYRLTWPGDSAKLDFVKMYNDGLT